MARSWYAVETAVDGGIKAADLRPASGSQR